MRLTRGLVVLAALCLSALFLVSCGDGDSSTNPDNDGPPAITSPPIVESVDFNSDDPTAQGAQAMVSASLATARATTAFGTGLLSQPGENDWDGSGDCYTWSYSAEGCTWTYEACEGGDGFIWTVTLDGNCDGRVYSDWVALSGETNVDGTSGTLRIYEENESVVTISVTWTRSANDDAGTWNFYNGDVTPANLQVTMTWSETAPGTGQITWEAIELSKWVLNYTLEGNAGTMLFYDWDAGWELDAEITWNVDGTGNITTYDGMGGSTTESW